MNRAVWPIGGQLAGASVERRQPRQVEATQARVIAAADATRLIERDLHDGTQQRAVAAWAAAVASGDE
jgi:hypothetical protein